MLEALGEAYQETTWLGEATFYAFAYAFAFLSCFFRTLSDDAFVTVRRCIAVSGVSGFLGASIVAVLIGRGPTGIDGGHWAYLGVAALIGLAGRQQDQILQLILKKIGLADDSNKSKQTE